MRSRRLTEEPKFSAEVHESMLFSQPACSMILCSFQEEAVKAATCALLYQSEAAIWNSYSVMSNNAVWKSGCKWLAEYSTAPPEFAFQTMTASMVRRRSRKEFTPHWCWKAQTDSLGLGGEDVAIFVYSTGACSWGVLVWKQWLLGTWHFSSKDIHFHLIAWGSERLQFQANYLWLHAGKTILTINSDPAFIHMSRYQMNGSLPVESGNWSGWRGQLSKTNSVHPTCLQELLSSVWQNDLECRMYILDRDRTIQGWCCTYMVTRAANVQLSRGSRSKRLSIYMEAQHFATSSEDSHACRLVMDSESFVWKRSIDPWHILTLCILLIGHSLLLQSNLKLSLCISEDHASWPANWFDSPEIDSGLSSDNIEDKDVDLCSPKPQLHLQIRNWISAVVGWCWREMDLCWVWQHLETWQRTATDPAAQVEGDVTNDASTLQVLAALWQMPKCEFWHAWDHAEVLTNALWQMHSRNIKKLSREKPNRLSDHPFLVVPRSDDLPWFVNIRDISFCSDSAPCRRGCPQKACIVEWTHEPWTCTVGNKVKALTLTSKTLKRQRIGTGPEHFGWMLHEATWTTAYTSVLFTLCHHVSHRNTTYAYHIISLYV